MARIGKPEPFRDQDCSGFSSGNSALDAWLKKSANKAQKLNTAKVYVVSDENKVVGYYAIASASMVRDALPTKVQSELPRHPVPGLLLARLAVDSNYQNQGIGRALVRDAVSKALSIQQLVGAAVLLVHSKDEEASRFYLSLGFEPSPGDRHLLCLYLNT